MQYKDKWKVFKIKLLKQIDYFDSPDYDEVFFNEIQYHLKDEFHEEGNVIHLKGDPCRQLMFVVKGRVEL